MIYIRRNGKTLEKYEINFDRTKLEELLKKVTIRCGEKHQTKKVCTYEYIPKSDDIKFETIVHYENVKYKKNGKTTITYYEYTPIKEDLYDCEYTQYNAPYLAYFIKRVIFGDIEAISTLFERDFSTIKYSPTVEEKIGRLNATLEEFDSEIIIKQKEKMEELRKKYDEYDIDSFPTPEKYKKVSKTLKELKALERFAKKEINGLNYDLQALLKIRELNKNQEHVDEYFKELVSLVEFRLIDTIDMSEMERINSFFEKEFVEPQMRHILKR